MKPIEYLLILLIYICFQPLYSQTGNYSAPSSASAGSGSNNTVVGDGAGGATITGSLNSLFGTNAGFNITSGARNSIFGNHTGGNLTSGSNNSFFGDVKVLFIKHKIGVFRKKRLIVRII